MFNVRRRRVSRFIVRIGAESRWFVSRQGTARGSVLDPRRWGSVVLAALLMHGVPAQAQGESGSAASEPSIRVVGGRPAASGSWPWQVALVTADGDHLFCGGSVIAPRWVLTAAHCVKDETTGALMAPDELQVLAGTQHLDEGGLKIDVKRIEMHEDYEAASTGNDIALLELARAAGVRAVVLPDMNRVREVATLGALATVTGWGLMDHRGGLGMPSRLMEVELPLVEERTCRAAYPAQYRIDSSTVCAGFPSGGKDSCLGDSGGPLVVRDGDDWLQVGIVSWGAGCARPGKYGVYTSTGAFAEWVERRTGLELAAAADTSSPGPVLPSPSKPPEPPVPPESHRGDRALVIGINRYADSRFDLEGAVQDADNMRALLAEHLGFDPDEVRVLTDGEATRKAILDGVRDWLVAGTGRDSRAVLYFAGHGYHRKDDDGDESDGLDEALVPHDARLVSAERNPMRISNLILDDEIRDLFAGLQDRHAYVIVDACHSGTITRGPVGPDRRYVRTIDLRLRDALSESARRTIGVRSGSGHRPEGFIGSSGNVVAWTAVSSSQFALEDRDATPRQGVFTRRFVQGLAERRADRNADGRVTHSELLDYVRRESDDYCSRHRADCERGLTPLLEGPPDVLGRDVLMAGAPAPAAATAGTVADDALGHDNTARVQLELHPSTRVRIGEEVRYRVHSERSGHLLLVDVMADGNVVQIFPNHRSQRLGKGTAIEAGRTVELNDYLGFRLQAGPPVGPGSLYAVVTEDPVSLRDLTEGTRDLRPVPDPHGWLLALGERLREPWTGESEVRAARWSATRLDYEIVQ